MSLRIQPRREHYMEIVLYFNHRPSALIRSTVHEVEVPKDGLMLRLTLVHQRSVIDDGLRLGLNLHLSWRFGLGDG